LDGTLWWLNTKDFFWHRVPFEPKSMPRKLLQPADVVEVKSSIFVIDGVKMSKKFAVVKTKANMILIDMETKEVKRGWLFSDLEPIGRLDTKEYLKYYKQYLQYQGTQALCLLKKSSDRKKKYKQEEE